MQMKKIDIAAIEDVIDRFVVVSGEDVLIEEFPFAATQMLYARHD